MKVPAHIDIYVRSMGKALRVTHIFDDVQIANAHMADPGRDDAAIAEVGPFIFLANKYEKGTTIPRDEPAPKRGPDEN